MTAQSDGPDSPKYKRGVMQIRPGVPLSFTEDHAAGTSSPGEDCIALGQAGATIKAYRDAAKEFLSGKYKDLEPFAPSQLRVPCNITVISCTNGLIVRYDAPTEGPVKVRSGTVNATLTELGPPISEYLIHFPPDPASYDPGPNGPRVELAKFSLTSDEVQPVASMRPLILAPSAFPQGTIFLPPPHKPPCLLSVTNELQIVMGGRIVPANADPSAEAAVTHEFVARSKIKLQLGWQAIEVYSSFDTEYWKPEYAPFWAETEVVDVGTGLAITHCRNARPDPINAARWLSTSSPEFCGVGD